MKRVLVAVLLLAMISPASADSRDSWQAAFAGSVTVALGGVIAWRHGSNKVSEAEEQLCAGGAYPECQPTTGPLTTAQVDRLNAKGNRGETSYSVRRRISVLVNALTSFSNRPLIYIFYLGSLVMLASLAAGALLIYEALRGHFGVPGWASIMVSIWFLGGLMIFCTGVIGIYLAKVFTESKRRPYTVVRADYRGDPLPGNRGDYLHQ